MRGSGAMIGPTGMGFIRISTGQSIVASGEKTYKMEEDMKNGLMEAVTLGSTKMVRNRG